MLCGCGCGGPTPIARKTDRRKSHIKGQPVRFIFGHQTRGRGKVTAIHMWLNKHFPRTGICARCKKKGKTDYAFLNHPKPHTRNIEDYIELCREHHCQLDGTGKSRQRDPHGRFA